MSIESYIGVEGVTINIETLEDVYEALDWLHSESIHLEEQEIASRPETLGREIIESALQAWDEHDLPISEDH
jgi:hypothetical protein